ncbi:MAG: periplasmic heavy metal sensor, partial [Pseudomonadota bacterium]
NSKRRRWVWIALCVSLAFNVLVAGFALGAAFRWGWLQGGSSRDHPVRAVLADLEPEKRESIRTLIKQRRDGMRMARRRVRAERRALRELVRAEDFDLGAFEAQRAKALAAMGQLREARFAYIGDMASQLNAAQRRRLLRALNHRRRHRRRR